MLIKIKIIYYREKNLIMMKMAIILLTAQFAAHKKFPIPFY
jgi:hypothetical protein